MFKTNRRIRAMIDRLYAVCETLDRGDVLTRETIQAIVEVEPNTGRWQHVVNRVRHRTENDRNISMMPIPNVGFGLCTHEQQLELGPYRQRRAARQLRRGIKSLNALRRTGELSAHQKQVLAFRTDGLRQQRRQLEEQARCRAALETQPLPFPRVRELATETA